MSALLPLLLHGLHEYGYAALWLTVFIAAVGLPLPISLLLLAAGAFAVRGDFNIALLIGITITASSCGDNVGYLIGRRWGSRTLHWLGQPGHLHSIPARTITRSRLYFQRGGGWAIFFSRFLFATLGGVTNLLAGADRYPYRHFLLYDVAGETLGALIPLSLGYTFGVCPGGVRSRVPRKDLWLPRSSRGAANTEQKERALPLRRLPPVCVVRQESRSRRAYCRPRQAPRRY